MGSVCVVIAVSDKGLAGRCPGDHDISRQTLRQWIEAMLIHPHPTCALGASGRDGVVDSGELTLRCKAFLPALQQTRIQICLLEYLNI